MSAQQKVRIAIDFASVEDAREWMAEQVARGGLQKEADAFPIDTMDNAKDSGVTLGNTYIVRRAGTRPDGLLDGEYDNITEWKPSVRVEVTA